LQPDGDGDGVIEADDGQAVGPARVEARRPAAAVPVVVGGSPPQDRVAGEQVAEALPVPGEQLLPTGGPLK